MRMSTVLECAFINQYLAEGNLIALTINGVEQQLHASSNVTELIVELNLTGKRIAIERNGEIVPRSLFNTTALQPNDKLEIVVAVGGG
jgi:sulfur carrier protein